MNKALILLIVITLYDGALCESPLTKKLKESCSSVADCAIAYSTCKDKKCQCINGFKEKDGLCTTPKLQCPNWSLEGKSPVGKACTITVNYSIQDAEANNTCDKSKEFCYAYPKVKDQAGRLVGHCCVKPPKDVKQLNFYCPYEIESKGTCPDTSGLPADAPAPKELQRTCSYETHDCVQRFGKRVCCPLPCHGGSSHFAVDGKCYDYVQDGNSCELEAQCVGGAHCKQVGKGQRSCASEGNANQEPSVSVLTKKLKESCSSVAECAIAYSTCKNKKCQCIDGFKEKNGLCTTPKLKCPNWSPGGKSPVGKACTIAVNYAMQDAEANNTCDKSKEFCYAYPKVKDQAGRLVGHCCIKPPKDAKQLNFYCPYDIENNGTCPDTSNWPADAPALIDMDRTCPDYTHDCVQRFGKHVCCPLPCHGSSSHFAVDGKCYDYVQDGNSCEVEAQCVGGTHCKQAGKGQRSCASDGNKNQEPLVSAQCFKNANDATCKSSCVPRKDDSGCYQCDCGESAGTEVALLSKKLKESCDSVAECSIAFSTCKNKKCQCIDGFKEKNGMCITPELQCPNWSSQGKSPVGKSCTITVNYSIQDAEANNTCDKSKEFCYAHPNIKDSAGRLVGHCCLKPPKDAKQLNLYCPYNIESKGTCPDYSKVPRDGPAPKELQRTCSYTTHDCVQRFGQQVCCPVPCHGANSHFAVDGKCYDVAPVGGVCDLDAQCTGGSFCKSQGAGHPVCACKGKTFQEPSIHCERRIG